MAQETLFVMRGEAEHMRQRLAEGPVRIGRHPSNEVRLEDTIISSAHAVIARAADAWAVKDLASRNGVCLNGIRLEPGVPAHFDEGDEISVGPYLLRVERLNASLTLFHRGKQNPVRFRRKKELTLGRDLSHDLVLSGKSISSTHALIRRTSAGGVEVSDLTGGKATFVNGDPLHAPRLLAEGDEVVFGQSADARLFYGAIPAARIDVKRSALGLGPELIPHAKIVAVFRKQALAAVSVPDEYGDPSWAQLKRPLGKCLMKIAEALGHDEAAQRKWRRTTDYQTLSKALKELILEDFASSGNGSPLSLTGVWAMDGREFEAYLASIFRQAGFAVLGTKTSRDQGADLEVERGARRGVVQAKRWKQTVGNEHVAKTLMAKGVYKAEDAWLITTSRFSSDARRAAHASGITLVDGAGLAELHVLLSRR